MKQTLLLITAVSSVLMTLGGAPAHAIGDTGHCPEWSCGANGPALTGTRAEQSRKQGETVLPETPSICSTQYGCGDNGPALMGTRAEQHRDLQEVAPGPGQALPHRAR